VSKQSSKSHADERRDHKTGEEYEAGYVRRQNREWENGSYAQDGQEKADRQRKDGESAPSGDTNAGRGEPPYLSDAQQERSGKYPPDHDAAPTQPSESSRNKKP
jgi:hypothetical protein